MEFSREQRRALVALACKVAWADGVVTDEERDFVRGMVSRFAAGHIEDAELDHWLTHTPPDVDIIDLPKGVDQLFVYESMRLMEADGDLADEELAALEDIMNRVFNPRPQGTELARIAVEKKAIPLPKK